MISVALRSQSEIDTVNNANIASGDPSREGPLGISGLNAQPTGAYVGHDPVSSVQTGLNETSNALGLIADGLGQLGSSIVNHPTERPPVTGPVGIARTGRHGLLGPRAGVPAVYRRAAVGQPGPGQHPAVPAARRRTGAVPVHPANRRRDRFSVRAEQLTYLAGFGLLMVFLVWITFFDLTNLGSATP